jgi:hypothetical protein
MHGAAMAVFTINPRGQRASLIVLVLAASSGGDVGDCRQLKSEAYLIDCMLAGTLSDSAVAFAWPPAV